jgi:hypothetical protein
VRTAVSAVLSFCGLIPAVAADLSGGTPLVPYGPQPSPFFLSEIRIGGSLQDPSGPESGSGNIVGEILFAKPILPVDPLVNLLIPRLHVGASVNFAGDTSFAYAGLTWTFDLTTRFFVEGSLGGAVHNGNTSRIIIPPDEAALGCSPLFRESAGVGVRLTQEWSVMASVEHLSNAGLCSQNRGLTNFGLRLGYSF